MGLLDGDSIRNIFGAALSGIYASGQLIKTTQQKNSKGSLVYVEQTPENIKVQRDKCTEAMMRADGYTSTDVKLIVLRAGLSTQEITSDDIIVAYGVRWKMFEVTTDAAQSYFVGRASMQRAS